MMRVVNMPRYRAERRDYYRKTMKVFKINSFSRMPPELFRDKKFLKENRNHTTLWLYLYSNVIRKPLNKDNLNIYKNYFCDNWLACSLSMNEIAEAFGYSYNDTKTVRRWLNKLVKDKYIEIDQIQLDAYRNKNIYVLGVHDNNKDYLFTYNKFKVGEKDEGNMTSTDEGNMTSTDEGIIPHGE